eukprot:5411346-Prymnesium_polylepis.1
MNCDGLTCGRVSPASSAGGAPREESSIERRGFVSLAPSDRYSSSSSAVADGPESLPRARSSAITHASGSAGVS